MSVQPDPIWPTTRPGGDHSPAVGVRTGFEPPEPGSADHQAAPVMANPMPDLNGPRHPNVGFQGAPPHPGAGPFPSTPAHPGLAVHPPGAPPWTAQPGFPPPQAGYPPTIPSAGFGPQPVNPSDERLWATMAHAGALVAGFVAPLVIYLVYKDRSPFIRRHAAQALNFHIMMLLGLMVTWVLMFVVIGVLLLPLIVLAALIVPIVAAVAANRGEEFSYPLTPQMVT